MTQGGDQEGEQPAHDLRRCEMKVLGAAREVVDDVIRGDIDIWLGHYIYIDSPEQPPNPLHEVPEILALDHDVFLVDDVEDVWLDDHDISEEVEVREAELGEVAVRRRWWWPF